MNRIKRTKTLRVRLDENEMATLETMARGDRLLVATFARQYLLREAERRGIVPAEKAKQADPSPVAA